MRRAGPTIGGHRGARDQGPARVTEHGWKRSDSPESTFRALTSAVSIPGSCAFTEASVVNTPEMPKAPCAGAFVLSVEVWVTAPSLGWAGRPALSARVGDPHLEPYEQAERSRGRVPAALAGAKRCAASHSAVWNGKVVRPPPIPTPLRGFAVGPVAVPRRPAHRAAMASDGVRAAPSPEPALRASHRVSGRCFQRRFAACDGRASDRVAPIRRTCARRSAIEPEERPTSGVGLIVTCSTIELHDTLP